jgi:tetratricopeptide (TPR) repeat protein
MAKKKAQPPDETPKRPGRGKSRPKAGSGKDPEAAPPDLSGFDPQVVEDLFRSLVGDGFDEQAPAKSGPAGKAAELVAQARVTLDAKRAGALAKKALEADPNCIDAFLVLADLAKSRKAAVALFEQAVAAGERQLGPDFFEKEMGNFWGLIETRPYMRARATLAEALWSMGQRDQAADHLRELLQLNPGDNQGLRYVLTGWLLHLDRLDELDELLSAYDENSTTWAYTRALLGFRREGDTPAQRKTLQAAKKVNKHVAAYLLGHETLPPEPPALYSPGDRDDAVLYVASNLSAWKSTPGALAWLRERIGTSRKRKIKLPAPIGPSALGEERLRRLPRELDTWQADFRQFSRRIEVAGERIRPWMVLVSSQTRELVLAHSLFPTEDPPEASRLWDVMVEAMETPAAGEPHRPTEIRVRGGAPWTELEEHLEAIGVTCSPSDELDQIDSLFDDLIRFMAGAEQPGLLDMPGVNADQVGQFYEVAAEFYRRAPWRSLAYESVIRIECDRYDSGPWFGVIMGQSGLTLGLALYEDLALLRRMWAGKLSDEQGARKTVALTITYDDEMSMAEADLVAIEEHGWTIAGPEAYPSIFRKERGLSMRPPLSWEIDLMSACLRALPDFVLRRSPDDTTRELVRVPGTTPPLELGLSWVAEPR